ncbi:hypothetical protein C8R44DRAFT_745696 [Mycena epipterygia]|nr:hypothetical protein C8R44DRAFT_745696 [Mycena epipterygia]
MILAQFGYGYYIRGTLKRLMAVLAWLIAWWILVSVTQVTDQKSMPLLPWWRGNAHKVMILAQFGYGYYIRGTLKRLMAVLAWLKAWWIYYICGTLKRLTDVVAWFKAWWICLKAWWISTRNPCHSCLAGEEMAAKVMILAQSDHGYYIRGTLKRLTDVLAWLKAWWILVSVKQVTDQKSIPLLPWQRGNALILAQFGHGYYIRGTLKRLTDVVAWLKAWWIRMSVKQVTDQKSMPFLPRRRGNARKTWWIRVSVTQVTDQKSMPLLPWWRGNAHKVMILAQFGYGYYIRGTLKRLMAVLAWLIAWWIRTRNPCPRCFGGEEMPAKVMILAQFDHGYYIRGALKRLMGDLAWLKAWWIRVTSKQFDHGYYIRGTLKSLTDVVAWLKAWEIRTRNPCSHCPGREEMPTKVMILAQFGHGYYIRGTLKRLTDVVAWLKAWWIRTRNRCHSCLAGEEMPAKVMILAQFDHGYYIRGTLKRLMGVLAWLKAWWIRTINPCHCWLAGEEMPAKVMILAQFDHGYYIRGTLKRLTDVVAWLKAWWICVSVKQVTAQKSMPLLPR